MCIVPGGGYSQLISMPGEEVEPRRCASAAASAMPPMVSWSVRARPDEPVLLRQAHHLRRRQVPSEAVEWQWRSTYSGMNPLP